MEGGFDLIATYNKAQVEKVFNNAQRQGNFYMAVNKRNQEKVRDMLQQTANMTNGFKSMGRSKPRITVNWFYDLIYNFLMSFNELHKLIDFD